jgi:hypothetical protein
MNALRGESVLAVTLVPMAPPELIVISRISGCLPAKEVIRKAPMHLIDSYGTKEAEFCSKDAWLPMDANSLQTNVRYYF